MKKLQSTWYNMAIVLTLISVVAGAGLAYVNSITKDKIDEIKQQKLSEGICSVLSLDPQKTTIPAADTLQSGAIAYVVEGQGTAVQVTDPNGFGGDFTVLFGFNDQGVITGYTVLETNETPGLGAKAEEWFRVKDTKHNVIGMNPAESNMTVSKDGGDVEAITASTITSRAFLRALNAAYKALGELSGAPVETQSDANTGATGTHHENKWGEGECNPETKCQDGCTDCAQCDSCKNNKK